MQTNLFQSIVSSEYILHLVDRTYPYQPPNSLLNSQTFRSHRRVHIQIIENLPSKRRDRLNSISNSFDINKRSPYPGVLQLRQLRFGISKVLIFYQEVISYIVVCHYTPSVLIVKPPTYKIWSRLTFDSVSEIIPGSNSHHKGEQLLNPKD